MPALIPHGLCLLLLNKAVHRDNLLRALQPVSLYPIGFSRKVTLQGENEVEEAEGSGEDKCSTQVGVPFNVANGSHCSEVAHLPSRSLLCSALTCAVDKETVGWTSSLCGEKVFYGSLLLI